MFRSHGTEMSNADYQALLRVVAWTDECYDMLEWHNITPRASHGSYLRESYLAGRSPRFTVSVIVHGLVN